MQVVLKACFTPMIVTLIRAIRTVKQSGGLKT